MYHRTNNEIKYDEYCTGPQGARYILHPVGDRNTIKQIQEAKAQLKREQDVVKITVEWIEIDEWRKMKIFFHPDKEVNDHLNKEYHARYKDLWPEYSGVADVR